MTLTKPDDIPQDVWDVARRCIVAGAFDHVEPVARAILAERERCAKIARKELKNTSILLSNPPKSSAAWGIRIAILGGYNV